MASQAQVIQQKFDKFMTQVCISSPYRWDSGLIRASSLNGTLMCLFML